MTFTIEFPDDLGQQIEQEASLRGIDAQAFIIEAIQRALDPDAALNALLVSLGGEGKTTYDDEEDED